MFPSALHVLQGIPVRDITTCHHLLQMAILGFDDLISSFSMDLKLAWSA